MAVRLIYTPEGGDRQVFDFDVDKLRSIEAEDLEEAGGASWDTLMGWLDKFRRGSWKAWRAALWIMMRRQNPTLNFDDVAVDVGELEMETDDDAPGDAVGKDEPADTPTGSPSPEPGSALSTSS